MLLVNTSMPKLCHARPGDAVRLLDRETGNPLPELYIVCIFNQKGKRHMRPCRSEGLYDEQRPLFLVNLTTGEAAEMPHLSSRVQIVRDARIEAPFDEEPTNG